jgi:predicted nicotinamide N-methyase
MVSAVTLLLFSMSIPFFVGISCNQASLVHELPQIYQKPENEQLIQVLEELAERPPTFSSSEQTDEQNVRPLIDPSGVPRYLTSIVSSSLTWIDDEAAKEQIWNLASLRLSERSGRNAMPSMTRRFEVTEQLNVALHEPSMTEDNLGLKTWTSSLLLSRLLPRLQQYVPDVDRILELGAGTGLLGISVACLWKTEVSLTDLPEVVPNLKNNLLLNQDMIKIHGGSVTARALDWADGTDLPMHRAKMFPVIVAADPIYSSNHPKILVETISRWLSDLGESRVIIALPLREHYAAERSELKEFLVNSGLQTMVEGTEVGYDDWYTREGRQAEVEIWWSVWQRKVS